MKNYVRWTVWFLIGTLGCHQEPLVPQSAIPSTCRIYQLININEGLRDTTTYVYTSFGEVSQSLYRQWSNGRLTNETEQSFAYGTDHYLFSQIEKTVSSGANGTLTRESKGYTYTYQDGRVQQVAIIDNLTNDKLGFREYTYDNGNLKTYSETNGNKTLVRRYTYDAGGRLINYDEPTTGVTPPTLSNGKIVKRAVPNGIIYEYEYDGEGQLIKQTTTSASRRSQYTYTYDSKPYWTKTQLRLRGIPSPDLGESTQVHNILTSSYQDDRSKGVERLVYTHAYNASGFSRGYGRSDGVRQINYYSNCP